ncbi:hypothetical protein [Lysinibacter cavernae]|uniref:hypothetical protein n=1 Tax=Lysinibacter cavernae TaxID=1640652 RepID=UPI00360DA788
MAIERLQGAPPKGYNPSNPEHTKALMRNFEESHGPGWRLISYNQADNLLHFERDLALTEVSIVEGRDEYTVALGPDVKPSEGHSFAARIESDPRFEGFFMTDFRPHIKEATLSKLTTDEYTCREKIAAAIGVPPWEVKVNSTKKGGFYLVLPSAKYLPAKHDKALNEIATGVVGADGWYVKTDPKKSTAEIVPGKPPTFPSIIHYPFESFSGDPDDLDFKLNIPIGEALGKAGEPNSPVYIPLADTPGGLISGTAGGGKAQPLWSRLPVPISRRYPTGQATMKDLRVGDFVIGSDLLPKRISGFSEIREEPVFQLRLNDGQTVPATAEHLWKVSSPEQRALRLEPTEADIEKAAELDGWAASSGYSTSSSPKALARSLHLPDSLVESLLHSCAASIGSVREGEILYPTEEAAVILADYFRAGRNLTYLILRTIDLIQRTGMGIALPGVRDWPSELGVGLETSRSFLTGEPLSDSELFGDSRYELAASLMSHPDGVSSAVSSAVASTAVNVLRSTGVKSYAEGTKVICEPNETHLLIEEVKEIGIHESRCLFVESPDHIYLSEGWVPTHNSVSVNALVYGLLVREWEVVICDLPHKAGDFEWVKPYVREGGFACQGPASILAALKEVYLEKDRRAAVLKEYGVQKVQDLPPHVRPPFIGIIIDELSGIFSKAIVPKIPKKNGEIHSAVKAAEQKNFEVEMTKHVFGLIPAELRFVGIRIISATQMAQGNTGVDLSLKVNLAHRWLLGSNPSPDERGHALKNPASAPEIPENLRSDRAAGKGIGIVEFEGVEPAIVKSYFATTDEYQSRLRGRGMKMTLNPEPSLAMIQRHVEQLYDEEDLGFGLQPQEAEPWQIDPATGKKLTGYALANAARHEASK